MSKRIIAQRNEQNTTVFVKDTNYIKLDESFDAIALVADGELVVGRIHRFFVTEFVFNYSNGAKVEFKDIPPNFGQFKVTESGDSETEWLSHDGVSPAVMTTPSGEAIVVSATLVFTGQHDPATGVTKVSAQFPELVAVNEEEGLNPESAFLPVYKSQACPSKYLAEQSGFVLEATAEVATA